MTLQTPIKILVSLALLALFNLTYYQLVDNSFVHLKILEPDAFNAAPQRNGIVDDYGNLVSRFSYTPLEGLSEAGFNRFFAEIAPTGEVLTDSLAVIRRTRDMYVHKKGNGPFPFIPDAAIEDATSRPVVCGTYARTSLAALEHLGHVGRILYLNGHITLEMYDFEREKWLYIDPNFGMYLTDPDGSILSMTEFQARFRKRERVMIHSVDESTDDPQLVYDDFPHEHGSLRISLPRALIYVNGYTAFEDGAGYNYRRKSLLYDRKPAHMVFLRDEESSPWLALGGFGPIVGMNLVLLCLLSIWVFRGAGKVVGSDDRPARRRAP